MTLRASGLLPIAALSALLLLTATQDVHGQLPTARLQQITPSGGKCGSVVEVTIQGTDLDRVTELRFSHPGLSATGKGTNRFEVSIADDVPPGTHEVRAVGKYGASNPRAFAVGLLKEVSEEKSSVDLPQLVPLESTINGRLEANTVDSFRFNATRGQHLIVRCETRAIDSKAEPVLTLRDASGREVKRSRTGGLLQHRTTEDTEFTVRLHDITYRGGADFHYRLSIGTFPRIEYVTPLSGEFGSKMKLAVFGHNLPGAGKGPDDLERAVIELTEKDASLTRPRTTLPAQSGVDLHEWRLRNDRGVSEGTLVRFPTAPIMAEKEQNNSSSAAQKITPPCEVAGQLSAGGDRDWFRFNAKKGEVYWIEVVSHRLGLPTDPFVLIQRAGTNGAADVLELNDSAPNAGGVEFNTTHRDPAGRFDVKQDGNYLIGVRDLFSHPPASRGLVYHLIVRPANPDFQLVALPITPPPAKKDAKDIAVGTTALRRDEVMPVKIIALRREGFDGAIDVSARDLPKGISATAAQIEPGKTSALVFLRADHGCPPTVSRVTFQGVASPGGTNLVREARAASLSWPVADPQLEAVQSRGSGEYIVSTMEDAFPVRLAAGEDKTWEGAAGSKVRIPLRLSVDGELSGILKLKAVGVTALEGAKEFDLDPKSTNAVYEIDLGQQKLAPGNYSFALHGSAPVKAASAAKGEKKPKETTLAVYSTPITLKVTAPSGQTNSPAK